ncbi:hypothetical protein [Oceanisphaera sp.]|uniref:hypothetical protein n=1 Tax=Oceanisphaera sp. TaxID=1929979 RepID=UPI003A9157DE
MLKHYSGPERRQQQRRRILDRRDLLRWPPEDQERRMQSPGRRKVDQAKSLWGQ